MKIRKSDNNKSVKVNGDIIMDYKKIILNKLLDKYEKSKSLYMESNRKIILNMEEVDEYDIEDFESKEIFHDTVEKLRDKQIVDYLWRKHEERKHNGKNVD